MRKLLALSLSLITFFLLNRGQAELSVNETKKEIIVQNSWIQVEILKETGEISSLLSLEERSIKNLLTKPASIIIRDNRDSMAEYRLSEGKVVKISTGKFSDSVQVIFKINFTTIPPFTVSRYSIQVIYTLGLQALRWDAILQTDLTRDWEANIDFSIPVIGNMEYTFWTNDDAPFKLPITRTVIYRKLWDVIAVIPALILYNETSNIGFSFISPFELRKPGLQFKLDTTKFLISNYYLRLSKNHPTRAAVYIIPHEGCWRPGFSWLLDKYPGYFNPVSKNILNGEGWFNIIDERTDKTTMLNFKKRGLKWAEFVSHFPFFGLYAPTDRDSWMVIVDTNSISYENWMKKFSPELRWTSYKNNNSQIEQLANLGIQTYIYFQSFESWKEYARKFYPNDIALGANNETLPAWNYCYLMNPDPAEAWGKHIDSQITTLLDKYPKVDGIFYDRDDYCNYDYKHDDGVTMIGNKPVYMLGFAQEKINELILTKVHKRGKGVWANLPTSIEVCKGMDGIMSEDLRQASYIQYLGIKRPLILLPYDTTPLQTEEKLKTALYTGHFPSIAWYRANPECYSLDTRYQLLFKLYKNKKWILYPRALQLPEDINGNIFQIPDSDYLIAMVDPKKFLTQSDPFQYDRWAKVKIPDFQEIKYCYLLSGDYKGVNQCIIDKDSCMKIRIPAHRASSLIRLSKEPRYEITRTSSPVLTRGDTNKFIIRIQNIKNNGSINYSIQITSPFGQKSTAFTLNSQQFKEETLKFYIPYNYTLEETTMKIILQRPRSDTIIFTSWIVDLVKFHLLDNIFIHFTKGEDIPFTLVNNTERNLKIRLTGSFIKGQGELKLPKQSIVLKPLESMELNVNITSYKEAGKIQLLAKAENRTIEIAQPVERAMKPEPGDYFTDDFSSNNMDLWDPVFGSWQTQDGLTKGSDLSHIAIKNENWSNFRFQINTKSEGSSDPRIDWIKSYIFFRVKDINNLYRFGIMGGPHGDDINLYKRVNGSWELLAKDQFKAKKDVWYNLKVEVKGDSIKGFLDGLQVISVKDTTFKSGGIGIGVLEDNMMNYYDDVVVRKIQEDP
jgi:hypothetical protein